MEIWYGMGGKPWLPAFSPFPTMFSKGFFPRLVKSRDCVVNFKISIIFLNLEVDIECILAIVIQYRGHISSTIVKNFPFFTNQNCLKVKQLLIG